MSINTTRRILGIDPGSHRLGWAIITGTASSPTLIDSGFIELPRLTDLSIYLPHLYNSLNAIIKEYHPSLMGIETLLFQKNVKTAISVAQARGVILLSASQQGIAIRQYAPNTIKSTVAGYGSATKLELARMVGLLLKINVDGLIDDQTDAIAVGLTGLIIK